MWLDDRKPDLAGGPQENPRWEWMRRLPWKVDNLKIETSAALKERAMRTSKFRPPLPNSAPDTPEYAKATNTAKALSPAPLRQLHWSEENASTGNGIQRELRIDFLSAWHALWLIFLQKHLTLNISHCDIYSGCVDPLLWRYQCINKFTLSHFTGETL